MIFVVLYTRLAQQQRESYPFIVGHRGVFHSRLIGLFRFMNHTMALPIHDRRPCTLLGTLPNAIYYHLAITLTRPKATT